jgi:D-alanyl-D-alanine carboxypeptidase
LNRPVRPSRPVRLLVSGAVLALALLTGGPAGAAQPTNRPTPLAGVENGAVPPHRLIAVGPGCQVARAAAPSLALLYRTASSAGVRLGARDCYRPVGEQVGVASTWTARGNSACAAAPQRYPDGRPKGTSMHGWGKAVDFSEAGPVTFASPGYRFLKAHAEALGWNHPGWAEPGGGPCPEPWHWEWIGDGGVMGGPITPADVVAVLPAAGDGGYAVVSGLGAVRPTGTARFLGSAESYPLSWVVVAAAPTPKHDGYWLVAADGGIFSFGAAQFYGSTGAMRLNAPIVGMAPTPKGDGYWLVAADGGVFSFGAARYLGGTGGIRLNQPIVAMARTPEGDGYWLAAADGGIFSFGGAHFHGSAAGRRLATPVVAMASTSTGDGYWIVAADGTVVPPG